MQLNDIIEENTFPSISKKTRLSVENLEKLFAQDFGAFRKVQALGFISILEREYHADLGDLREACHAYYSSDHAADNPADRRSYEEHLNSPYRTPSVVTDIGMGKKRSFPVRPLVITLLVIGLLYAAWQTYSVSIQVKDSNGSHSGDKVAFFSTILNKATAWMAGEDTPNVGDEIRMDGNSETERNDVNESGDSFVIADAQTTTQPQSTTSDPSTQEDENDIIQQVRAEQAKKLAAQRQNSADTQMQTINDALAAAPEENGSDEMPLATEVPSIVNEKQSTDEAGIVQETVPVTTEAEARKAKQQAEAEAARLKAAEEKALREREARQKAAEEQAMRERAAREEAARLKALQQKAAREKAARERAAKAKIVVIKPRKKAWLGIVNLTNMKRRVATSTSPQTFDTAKGKWIVATGHGYLDFTVGLSSMKFNDGKQHFLLIKNGKVKEIPHETFQKLNKSKVW